MTMRKIVIVSVVLVAMMVACVTTQSHAASAKVQKVKEMGYIMGYALACASANPNLIPGFTDQESAQFNAKLKKFGSTLSPSDGVELQAALGEGMMTHGQDGGAQCWNALNDYVTLYREFGLTGDAYIDIRDKFPR
jgi:hypothetical protein